MTNVNVFRSCKRVFLSIMSLFVLNTAWGVPIVNTNTPGAVKNTVYRDSQDSNLYYVAPTSMQLDHDGTGLPLFSYLEEGGFFVTHALVQAVLVPKYNDVELEAAKKAILAINPSAKFAAVPFASAEIQFDQSLSPLILSSDCGHDSGVVGQQQTCAFELNDRGRRVLRDSFKNMLTITMSLQYTVDGLILDGKGGLSPKTVKFSVGAYFGGPELAQFPQLFRDSSGAVIHTEN